MVLTSLCLLMGIRPVVKAAMIEEPGAGTRIGASVVHRAGATKNDRALPRWKPPRALAAIGFIGLGVMGYPMAGHLARAGHGSPSTTGPPPRPGLGRRSTAAARPPRPPRRPGDAEFVFVCVGNDDDLRAVVLGPGRRLRRHDAGAPSSSTTPRRRPSVARELHAHRRGARACTSSTRRCRAARRAPRTARSPSCAAATPRRSTRAQPVIAAYARAVPLVGAAGRRPARQDGEPDLHRGPGAGAVRRHRLRREGRPRHASWCWT